MRHIALDDLALFRHVAEAGSITGGAARAHLALAAASARIRDMEIRLGVRLLERTHRGVTTTPAGVALLNHARSLIAQADRMHDDMSSFAGGSGGHVRLLSNTNAIVEFLPDVLATFLARYPGTTVDLQERVSDEIVGLVAEGATDLGLVAGTVETGTLETYPFREDHFVLVVAANHPWAKAPALAFADVLDADFIGLDRDSALTRFLAGRAAREGRRMLLRVQLRSFDGVCQLVAAGVGVGIVPQTTARRAARVAPIVAVRLTDPWAKRDLRICLRDKAALSLSALRLLEAMQAT